MLNDTVKKVEDIFYEDLHGNVDENADENADENVDEDITHNVTYSVDTDDSADITKFYDRAQTLRRLCTDIYA